MEYISESAATPTAKRSEFHLDLIKSGSYSPAVRCDTSPMNSIVPLANLRKSSMNHSIFKSSKNLMISPDKKDDIFGNHTRTYIAEGEGTENASVRKIAEDKVVTTSNIDRWKRTFQSMKQMLRKEELEQASSRNEDFDEEVKNFYDRSKKGTMMTDAAENLEIEDIYEELTMKKIEKSFGIISPDSLFKMCWDLLSILFTLYQALTIPFKLAFNVENMRSLAIFEVIIDFFFVFDICILTYQY